MEIFYWIPQWSSQQPLSLRTLIWVSLTWTIWQKRSSRCLRPPSLLQIGLKTGKRNTGTRVQTTETQKEMASESRNQRRCIRKQYFMSKAVWCSACATLGQLFIHFMAGATATMWWTESNYGNYVTPYKTTWFASVITLDSWMNMECSYVLILPKTWIEIVIEFVHQV